MRAVRLFPLVFTSVFRARVGPLPLPALPPTVGIISVGTFGAGRQAGAREEGTRGRCRALVALCSNPPSPVPLPPRRSKAPCVSMSSYDLCWLLLGPRLPLAGGPPFAFVDFDDDRDAEDAVRGRDGARFAGEKLRVELARGGRRTGAAPSGSRGPPRHSEWRVLVSGLPAGTSWQDLKDHMRQAGNVGFSEVTRDGASPSPWPLEGLAR